MLTAQPLGTANFGRRTARAPAHFPRWKMAGALGLLCSTVAWASLPRGADLRSDEAREWRALGIASDGKTGLPMAPTAAVEPIDVAPERARIEHVLTLAANDSMRALLMRAGAPLSDATAAAEMVPPVREGTSVRVTLGKANGTMRRIEQVELNGGLGETFLLIRAERGFQLHKSQAAIDDRPVRIRGRARERLYWTLRAAGASPQAAAQYLNALAGEIDVGGDIAPGDQFDLILASRSAEGGERQEGALLYAGLERAAAPDLQLVRWGEGARSRWINAANVDQPVASSSGLGWPTAGRITSTFGYRIHPIFRFRRFHSGVDFGARWGTPILAAADGQVVGAGWAGGYGRQVRIAHGGGVQTSYSHMSQIAASPGSFVRQGQVIGYVGSSGFSTGPHLHYEVLRAGVKVNPLAVRFAATPVVDHRLANAVKARLKVLLQAGTRRG